MREKPLIETFIASPVAQGRHPLAGRGRACVGGGQGRGDAHGARLKAGGQIPAAYLAQLPERLDASGLNRYCKRYTAGRFWSYQLCLDSWEKLPPCVSSPMFEIWYWAPPMNLLAGWKEYYFNMPYGELVSVIDSGKHECGARTPEGWKEGTNG